MASVPGSQCSVKRSTYYSGIHNYHFRLGISVVLGVVQCEQTISVTSTLCSSLILSCCNSSRLFSHCSRSSKSIPRYSQTTFSMSFLNTWARKPKFLLQVFFHRVKVRLHVAFFSSFFSPLKNGFNRNRWRCLHMTWKRSKVPPTKTGWKTQRVNKVLNHYIFRIQIKASETGGR